jgi:hypothetical protein
LRIDPRPDWRLDRDFRRSDLPKIDLRFRKDESRSKIGDLGWKLQRLRLNL